MKVWVIVPTNWEYNDEYSAPQGCGQPAEAFIDRVKAEEKCRQDTLQDLRDEPVGNFMNPYSDDEALFRKYLDDHGYLTQDQEDDSEWFHHNSIDNSIPDDILLGAAEAASMTMNYVTSIEIPDMDIFK